MVDIAQLVRVPGCGPGGRRFEPDYPPHFLIATQKRGFSFSQNEYWGVVKR